MLRVEGPRKWPGKGRERDISRCLLISFDLALTGHWFWTKLQAYSILHLPSWTAVYQIFTLTFQIYTLFTLDSIKYLHAMLNIHHIYIAPFFSYHEAGRMFGTFPKSWRRTDVKGLSRVGTSGDRSHSYMQGGSSLPHQPRRSNVLKTCPRENNCAFDSPHIFSLHLVSGS